MIVRPRKGEVVGIRYRESVRRIAPHHGATGVVRVVSRGPGPRNHGVEMADGRLVVVPCGQLVPIGVR